MPDEANSGAQENESPTIVNFSRAEAVPLASALVQRVAEEHGIRVLLLKGPLAHESGLRAKKISSDVDVLVLPHESDALITALEVHGWTPRPWPSFPTLLPPHSRTLIHPQWGIDIDVHFNWPGFLIEETEAFETMWLRRLEPSIAEIPVHTPALADAALILALHLLREAPQRWNRGESIPAYEDLVERVSSQDGLPVAIRSAAAELGAEQTARPFLRDLGFDIPATEPDAALRAWYLHGASAHPVSGWLNALANAPFKNRPGIIWRAIFPTEDELRAISPSGGNSRLDTIRRWWRRLKRGIRTTPAALRTLRRMR